MKRRITNRLVVFLLVVQILILAFFGFIGGHLLGMKYAEQVISARQAAAEKTDNTY